MFCVIRQVWRMALVVGVFRSHRPCHCDPDSWNWCKPTWYL